MVAEEKDIEVNGRNHRAYFSYVRFPDCLQQGHRRLLPRNKRP